MTSGYLASRAVVRVSPRDDGEDAVAFLQGLLTNDIAGDGPVYAALLTAQGKTMFDMIAWRDGADVLLDCEADAAQDLAKRLSLYRLRRAIDITVDPGAAVLWSINEADGFAPDPRLPQLGWRKLAAAQANAPAVDEEWKAHRLSQRVPEGRSELGDVLWLETNAVELNGVSFTKGCYIGQENTARMNWRQKVNRRLVVLPLDRSEEKRRKIAYNDLGMAVDHLRVADIPEDIVPDWLDLSGDA